MTSREHAEKIRAAKVALVELLSPGLHLDAEKAADPNYLSGFLVALLNASPAPEPPHKPEAAAGAGGAAAARERMLADLETLHHDAV